MILLADSPTPVFDAGWFILILSRVLHTVSAAVLLGGLIYLKKVVAPLATGASDPGDALYRGRRSTWSVLVMLATTFLFFSGIFNTTYYMGMGLYEDLPPTYHMLWGIKLLLALFVFFVAAGTAGKSPMAMNMQRDVQRWLNLAVGAAVIIFALGAVMRSFQKVPVALDAPEAKPPAAVEEVVEENTEVIAE
jgi:putative copper export protein